jgi:hypothetical protein
MAAWLRNGKGLIIYFVETIGAMTGNGLSSQFMRFNIDKRHFATTDSHANRHHCGVALVYLIPYFLGLRPAVHSGATIVVAGSKAQLFCDRPLSY